MMETKGPVSEDMLLKYWNDSYLPPKDNLWGSDPVPYIDKVITTLIKNGGQLFLDLPCGDGRNTIPMAANLPFVIGADTSTNALEITNKRIFENKIRNCILMQSDIFKTQFAKNQFDGIFCWDLLGHLKNASLALNELLRICKNSGIIYGSVFSIDDSSRGINMRTIGDEEYIYIDKFYFKFYSRDNVENLLNIPGINIIEIESVTWREPPHIGYREYPHNHTSWAFAIAKQRSLK